MKESVIRSKFDMICFSYLYFLVILYEYFRIKQFVMILKYSFEDILFKEL